MSDLITFLSSAGVSALVAAAFLFFARTWISERVQGAIRSEYEQKLETLKFQLKAQNDVALEHFKAELHIAATERSIRLTRVFEKTVETVAETYASLLAFHDAVETYTSIVEWPGGGTKADRRKIVAEKYTDFCNFYRPKKPFLPKSTVDRIDEFIKRLTSLTHEFHWGVEKEGDLRGNRRGDQKDTWSEVDEFMREKAPSILTLLEDDLRKILGTYVDAENAIETKSSVI